MPCCNSAATARAPRNSSENFGFPADPASGSPRDRTESPRTHRKLHRHRALQRATTEDRKRTNEVRKAKRPKTRNSTPHTTYQTTHNPQPATRSTQQPATSPRRESRPTASWVGGLRERTHLLSPVACGVLGAAPWTRHLGSAHRWRAMSQVRNVKCKLGTVWLATFGLLWLLYI